MEPSKILAILILCAFAAQSCWSIADERHYGAEVKRVVVYCGGVIVFTLLCVYLIVSM